MNGGPSPTPHAPVRHGGFTLLELMVTVGIAAILGMMAAPSLRDFVIRNRSSAASNEFMGGVLRARTEAVSRNSCVTMCASTTTTASPPSCSGATQTAWGTGWIVFRNEACDASVTAPAAADVLLVTRELDPDYSVTGGKGLLFFSASGQPRPADAGSFSVQYQSSTRSSNRTICMSPLGRTVTVNYGAACPP